MAVVSPLPAIRRQVSPIKYPEIDLSGMMMVGRDEIVVESSPRRVIEDKMYVTVGKVMKESKSNLLWVLHNSGGRKICLIHIHQPAQMIPLSNSLA